MKDIPVKNGITIPAHEVTITASRAGGPGGQHVNKASTRITVRWNIPTTSALTDEQKQRVMQKIASQLTTEGDLIIHNASSRSQHHNKEEALRELAQRVRKALHITKKRIKTKTTQAGKEKRLHKKKRRGEIKKLRRVKF